jgi:hypothetical protein
MMIDKAEVKAAAGVLERELGNWMLSELGDAVIADALWSYWPAFQNLSKARRAEFAQAVSDEIYD